MCVFHSVTYSALLVLHAVNEVEESRACISLLLVVAVSETSIHVEALSNEDLDLVELLDDVFAHLGGALLELSDSLFFAVSLEVSLDLLHISYETKIKWG